MAAKALRYTALRCILLCALSIIHRELVVMGIDGVHIANIATLMDRANGKAVQSMVFDVEDLHREQLKMCRGSACPSGTVSTVSWIFKEQGQVDLELDLLGDAIAAAFSNQCSQSGSFEPPSKHSADSAANKVVMHVSLF